MRLSPGSTLGPYEIVSTIGAGGMGEVYRARDTRLGRDVAIKVLPKSRAADDGAIARFEREAQAIAALSHPNILAIHDVGHDEDVVYTVSELLEGETVGQRLAEGPLPARKAKKSARKKTTAKAGRKKAARKKTATRKKSTRKATKKTTRKKSAGKPTSRKKASPKKSARKPAATRKASARKTSPSSGPAKGHETSYADLRRVALARALARVR